MTEHDPYANHPGERELIQKHDEQERQQIIEGAVAHVVSKIEDLDEDVRREVLKQALKMVKSSLVIRKSGK